MELNAPKTKIKKKLEEITFPVLLNTGEICLASNISPEYLTENDSLGALYSPVKPCNRLQTTSHCARNIAVATSHFLLNVSVGIESFAGRGSAHYCHIRTP
jgi:hypothetical protein